MINRYEWDNKTVFFSFWVNMLNSHVSAEALVFQPFFKFLIKDYLHHIGITGTYALK